MYSICTVTFNIKAFLGLKIRRGGESGGRGRRRRGSLYPLPWAVERQWCAAWVTQGCLTLVACPLVYDSHLSSTNLCPQGSSCQVGGGTRPSQKASGSLKGEAVPLLQPPEPWGQGYAVSPCEDHGPLTASSRSPGGGPRKADCAGR